MIDWLFFNVGLNVAVGVGWVVMGTLLVALLSDLSALVRVNLFGFGLLAGAFRILQAVNDLLAGSEDTFLRTNASTLVNACTLVSQGVVAWFLAGKIKEKGTKG